VRTTPSGRLRLVVALQHLLPALQGVAYAGAVGLDPLDRGGPGPEEDLSSVGQAPSGQVLDDLGLCPDLDAAPAQVGEVHAVGSAVEAQFDAVVGDALAVHALAETAVAEEAGDAVFHDARALAGLDVGAVPRFQHHRLDAGQVQQVGEQEAGGPCSDDADACAHQVSPRRSGVAPGCHRSSLCEHIFT
jgi:hypothetical protein